MVAARGWSDSDFSCLVTMWDHESGWRVNATNPYTGAYGIPQALPGSKMATVGPDWQTNPATQITWGLQLHSGPVRNTLQRLGLLEFALAGLVLAYSERRAHGCT